MARVLTLRGLTTPETADRFLRPSLDHLHNPYLLTDLLVGVDRLLAAIERKERICCPWRLRRRRHYIDCHSKTCD